MSEAIEQDPATYWEGRYAERERIWSGRPNAVLVDVVAQLPPGRAVDLGCGEGADTVWLAECGWRVTGVDIAKSAVTRAAEQAASRGVEDRVEWTVSDLAAWRPEGRYDLVSAFFLHSPLDFPRTEVLRRAAEALAPGGHLLVVGHGEPPPWAAEHAHDRRRFLGPDEEVAELGLGAGWEVVIAELRTRQATGPDGETAELRDSVVLFRRH